MTAQEKYDLLTDENKENAAKNEYSETVMPPDNGVRVRVNDAEVIVDGKEVTCIIKDVRDKKTFNFAAYLMGFAMGTFTCGIGVILSQIF